MVPGAPRGRARRTSLDPAPPPVALALSGGECQRRGRPGILGSVPIYEYRCENGHLTERFQRMSDPPLEVCDTCGAPVQKVLHPVAIHFKGSGFYNTDYGTSRRKRELEKSASDGADKNDAKQAEKKKDKPAGGEKPAA